MRVCFIIPSAEHMSTAGVRIRYERLASHNGERSLSVSIVPIPDLIKMKSFDNADVYVFSKVYTEIATVLTQRLQEAGKLVGVDIFDDYFSQKGDVRLQYYRSWIARCGPSFDFMICSTKRIAAFLQYEFPDRPVLMIPDPAPSCDLRRVWMLVNTKLERAIASRKLHILWFGMATNPFFPIGVHDLVAYSEELVRFRGSGWIPHLTILTNLNSLQTSHLTRLARLPVSYELEQWSVDRESELLDTAFMCFLPVNGQEFSQAKSLNRAISALSAGCQILSNGFPLYNDLSDLVYSSAAEIVNDLMAGRTKLGSETIAVAGQVFIAHANSYASSVDLERFLLVRLASRSADRMGEPALADSPRQKMTKRFPIDIGILHGSKHDTHAHKVAGTANALSIKSPFTQAKLNFDVRFDGGRGGEPAAIYVRSQILDMVAPEFRDSFQKHGEIGNAEMWSLAPAIVSEQFAISGNVFLEVPTPVGEICAYRHVMASVIAACNRLFPQLRIFISELGNLRLYSNSRQASE